MGTLTTWYACGHFTRTTLPGPDDQVQSSDRCMDCYRNSHKLLQETETLVQFVDRKLKEERRKR